MSHPLTLSFQLGKAGYSSGRSLEQFDFGPTKIQGGTRTKRQKVPGRLRGLLQGVQRGGSLTHADTHKDGIKHTQSHPTSLLYLFDRTNIRPLKIVPGR